MNPQQKAEYERLHPRVAGGRTGGGQFKVKQGAGMEGPPDEQVRELQRAINAAPGTGNVAADGRFGPVTAEAVRTFQRSQGINANGMVDDNTREALLNPAPLTSQQVAAQEEAVARPASRSTTSSRPGTASTASTAARPGTGGASSGSSGRVSLDPSDVGSIEDFQRKHGLKVDGVIGPDTQRALRQENHRRRTESEGDQSRSEKSAGTRDGGTGTLKRGDGGQRAGKQVKQMQTMLQDLGYDLGEGGVDGEFGADTEAAIKKLQDEYGLEPDGVIGPRTRKLLNRLSGRLQSEKKAELTGKAPTTGYKLIEGETEMDEAALTAAARKQIPKGSFVFPEKAPGSGSYPIHDIAHARNALARSSGTPQEAAVRAAVYARYPQLKKKVQEAEAREAEVDRLIEDAWGGKPGPNWKQVGPEARKKINPIVQHYAKMAHPFTACVRDNEKRFGPERAKKVCAVVKDMARGTTKWRKGGKKVSEAEFVRCATMALVEACCEDADDVVILAAYLREQVLVGELQEAQARRVLASTGTEQVRALARERVLRRRLAEAEVAPSSSLADQIGALNPGSKLYLPKGEVYRPDRSSYLVLTGTGYTSDPQGEFERERVKTASAAATMLLTGEEPGEKQEPGESERGT